MKPSLARPFLFRKRAFTLFQILLVLKVSPVGKSGKPASFLNHTVHNDHAMEGLQLPICQMLQKKLHL